MQYVVIAIVALVVALVAWRVISNVKSNMCITKEGQVALIYTNGKITGELIGPRRKFLRSSQSYITVDVSMTSMEIQSDHLITSDEAIIKAKVLIYYSVKDAKKAIKAVDNYKVATERWMKAALYNVLVAKSLKELRDNKAQINKDIKTAADTILGMWGAQTDVANLVEIDVLRTSLTK